MIRIALHGLSRTGKDTVGTIIRSFFPQMRRVAFGDIIKADLDQLIFDHFGFSAFTENDNEKAIIRSMLVHWGYANYQSVERRFFRDMPIFAVNTRIFRVREAKLWKQAGGVVWEVTRPCTTPAEPNEALEIATCRAEGLIDAVLENDGTIESLKTRVCALLVTQGFLP